MLIHRKKISYLLDNTFIQMKKVVFELINYILKITEYGEIRFSKPVLVKQFYARKHNLIAYKHYLILRV